MTPSDLRCRRTRDRSTGSCFEVRRSPPLLRICCFLAGSRCICRNLREAACFLASGTIVWRCCGGRARLRERGLRCRSRLRSSFYRIWEFWLGIGDLICGWDRLCVLKLLWTGQSVDGTNRYRRQSTPKGTSFSSPADHEPERRPRITGS